MESIVFDLGSGSCKVGLSSDRIMRFEIASVVSTGGEKPESKRKRPIESGIVTNWGEMETLWENSFKKLGVETEDYGLIMTEPFLNPKDNQEKMLTLAFERFDVKSFYVIVSASGIGSGKCTCLVTETGYGVTSTIPVYEGYALPHAMDRSNVAGEKVTEHLRRCIQKEIGKDIRYDTANDIKEKLSFCSLNFEKDLEESSGRTEKYDLPDGKSMEIERDALFRGGEVLFKPSFIGSEKCGVHEMTFNSIQKCDVDIRKDLYQNIVLSGGGTLMTGFVEKFEAELSTMVPPNIGNLFLRVIALEDRRYLSWKGSWVTSNLSSFKSMVISEEEYHDCGPTIVHRKCF